MFIHRGFFVCFIINFSCHQRQEKLQKKRRLRRRGFRKKKRSEPHFLLLQHSLPLKNPPLRFDGRVSFNFKSRLRRLDGMFAHLKTGEASWIWCHINQETTVRNFFEACRWKNSRFQLAENKHPKSTQNIREVLLRAIRACAIAVFISRKVEKSIHSVTMFNNRKEI